MCRSAELIGLDPGDLICCANTSHTHSSLETCGHRFFSMQEKKQWIV